MTPKSWDVRWRTITSTDMRVSRIPIGSSNRFASDPANHPMPCLGRLGVPRVLRVVSGEFLDLLDLEDLRELLDAQRGGRAQRFVRSASIRPSSGSTWGPDGSPGPAVSAACASNPPAAGTADHGSSAVASEAAPARKCRSWPAAGCDACRGAGDVCDTPPSSTALRCLRRRQRMRPGIVVIAQVGNRDMLTRGTTSVVRA